MVKAFLRFVAWIGFRANAKLVEIEKREAAKCALKPGTLVTLDRCKCRMGDHSGVWRIDHYDPDANDYKIISCQDGRSAYAIHDVMDVAAQNKDSVQGGIE